MVVQEGIPDHLLPAAAKSVRLHCGKVGFWCMHVLVSYIVVDVSYWPQLLEEGKIVLVGEANEDSPTSEVG